MKYKYIYQTPEDFANICMNSDGTYLTGLWFIGSKDEAKHCTTCKEGKLPIFEETIHWLDQYFQGKPPAFLPPYKLEHLTDFRREVMEYMLTIPFGKVVSYGEIAKTIAQKQERKAMSSQAVGAAVGWNPICILIPCHRVIGTNGSLTGYGGGMENKLALLKLEQHDISKFCLPKEKKDAVR